MEIEESYLENKSEEIPEEYKDWYKKHHQFIIPEKIEKSVAYDCQVNPSKYIKCSFYMNQYYDEQNDLIREQMKGKDEKEINSKIIRLFQPLSLRKSNIPRYITIDTATLINLFSEKGHKGKLLKTIKENQELIWEDYFRMEKKIFKSKYYQFNYTLQTDGVGCSLLFKLKSMKDKKYKTKTLQIHNDLSYIENLSDYQLEILKSKKIITADPGKLYLLYMMDDEGNTLKYSCKQRDTESLAKRNRRIKMTNKKNNEIVVQVETRLGEYLSTTVNYQKFKDFIKIKHTTNEQTKAFYEQELYRKLNWRTKVYQQRSEDKFLNRIEEKFGSQEDFMICIGDWSNPQGSCIHGPSTIGVGLKRLINKKYKTILIDEYNTSKKCCNCWRDVSYCDVGEKKKFRLLQCNHCEKERNMGSPEDENKSMFHSYLTRDKNSCINMQSIVKHMIYNNKKRPPEFCRGC